MRMNKSNLKCHLCFIGLLIFQVILMYGKCAGMGESIGGDEFFSYGLANNTDEYIFWDLNHIALEADENGFFNGTDLQEYLQVEKGEEFSFDRVFWNQAMDVHPPLYYLVLNSVSSLFTGRFSVWYGRGINIVIFILTEIILYLTGLKLVNSHAALLPCVIWGFSSAAQMLTGYIRMYALLSLFCIMFFYCHVRLIMNEKHGKKNFFLLIFTVVCGGLTHYYFYVYMVCLSGCYLLYNLFVLRRRKGLLKYICVCGLGGIINLCIFPAAIRHVLFSYRGEEVRDNLTNNTWLALDYVKGLVKAIFGEQLIIFIVIAVLVCAIGIWKIYKRDSDFKISQYVGNVDVMIALLNLFSMLLYTVIIMKTSIYVAWYYISPIYTVLCLEIMYVLVKISMYIHRKFGLVVCIVLALIFSVSVPDRVMRLYELLVNNEDAVMNEKYSYQGNDCVFLYRTWDNLFGGKLVELCEYDEICCINIENLNSINLAQIISNRNTMDTLVVYVPSGEIVSDIVPENLRLEKVEEGTRYDIYKMK